MAEIIIEVKGYQCERCGHKWVPHKAMPRTCPRCKSAYWDTPRKNKVVNKPQKRPSRKKSGHRDDGN